jgi:hypothetical protein
LCHLKKIARSAKKTCINAAAASEMIDQQTRNEQLLCANFLEPECHGKKYFSKKKQNGSEAVSAVVWAA